MVKNFGFMGNKNSHGIKISFIQNINFLIYSLVRKSSFPVELKYGPMD